MPRRTSMPRGAFPRSGGGGGEVILLSVALLLLLPASNVHCQRADRRQDTIDEWIRTIKQSPRAHSLSPSWNGRSPYSVIGVSDLPLQNEVSEEEAANRLERRRPPSPPAPQPQTSSLSSSREKHQFSEGLYSRGGDGRETSSGEYRPRQRDWHSSQEEKFFPTSIQEEEEKEEGGGLGYRDRLYRDRRRPTSHLPVTDRRPYFSREEVEFEQRGGGGRPGLPPARRPPRFPELRSGGGQRFERPFPGAGGGRGRRRQPFQGDERRGGPRYQRIPGSRRPFPRTSSLEERYPIYEDFEEDYEEVIPIEGEEGRELFEEGEEIPLTGPGELVEIDEYGVVDYDDALLRGRTELPGDDEEVTGGGGSGPTGFFSSSPPGLGIRGAFPEFGPNPFLKEEHPDFPRRSFEQPPRRTDNSFGHGSGDGRHPSQRKPQQQQQSISPRPHPQREKKPQKDLDVNVGLPPEYYKSPLRQRERYNELDSPRQKGPRFPSKEELQRGFKPYRPPSRPHQEKSFGSDKRHRRRPGHTSFSSDNRSHQSKEPLRRRPYPPPPPRSPVERRPPRPPLSPVPPPPRTTPRPIPTPGPGDFPPPPPRRPPPPPPTHPTHPPKITHPPGHYKTVFRPPRIDYFPEAYEEEFDDDSRLSYQRKSPPFPTNPFVGDDEHEGHRLYREKTEDGFFAMPESFPSLATLGAGFESMKIRTKRSADPDIMRLQERNSPPGALERRRRQLRRQLRQQRRQQQLQEQLRRQGEFGFHQDFWEDVDTDFFDDDEGPTFGQRDRHQPDPRRGYHRQQHQRPPQHQLLRHHQEQVYREQLERHRQLHQQFEPLTTGPRHQQQQQQRHRQAGGRGRRHKDPYPQQSVQSYPPYAGNFGRDGLLSYEEARDNEILGSGNFEIIKGGTFYDADTFYHTRYNSRPQDYYADEEGGGDFFENFRDFADIKNDLYRKRNNYY